MNAEHLISTDDSASALKRIKAAARKARGMGRPLQFDFEHGQWWVTNTRTGAQWSVVDCISGTRLPDGIDFELVTQPDEY